MGLQPRRRPRPPKAEEPQVASFSGTVDAKSDASVGAPSVEPQQGTIAEPRCRTYNADGASRCIKPLGHVGDGDPDHELEAADGD